MFSLNRYAKCNYSKKGGRIISQQKRSVYINPQRKSEIIPLLGEALLLYDQVVLNPEVSGCFQVLAANIKAETMKQLVEKEILKFAYYEKMPSIAKQTNNTPNTIILVSHTTKDILFKTIEKRIEKAFKPVYSKPLINKIKDCVDHINLEKEVLLESSRSDMQNLQYIKEVFSFVKRRFELPNFKVVPVNNGVYLEPGTDRKGLPDNVYTEATYGLHIIFEVNYRMALVNEFDDITCENEYEKFFNKKMKYIFQNNKYKNKRNNFLEMCDIHEFPDVKESIKSGMLKIEDIMKMREGNGKLLRVWLDEVTQKSLDERNDFIKEYLKILKNQKEGLSFPTRTIILGIFQGMSLVKPIESTALSVIKEYVMPKVVNGWQPRWFFDKARKIYLNRK